MEKVEFNFFKSPRYDVFVCRVDSDQSGEYVRVEVAEELLALLKECDSLLVKHHESRFSKFIGACPVCSKNNTENYPDNIFGRIEKLIQSLQ